MDNVELNRGSTVRNFNIISVYNLDIFEVGREKNYRRSDTREGSVVMKSGRLTGGERSEEPSGCKSSAPRASVTSVIAVIITS